MAWLRRLTEKFKSLGYQPEEFVEEVEFWIEDDPSPNHPMKMLWMFRIVGDEFHANYMSYSEEYGFKRHSSWKISESLKDGELVYTYHFPRDDSWNNKIYTDISYDHVEHNLLTDIEGNCRVPFVYPRPLCKICNIAPADAFRTPCFTEIWCFACTSKLIVCPHCGENGRAKRFRTRRVHCFADGVQADLVKQPTVE
jgi:hypothetical protein